MQEFKRNVISGVHSKLESENDVIDAYGIGKDPRYNIQRPISSTISRYACRIQINRDYPHRAFLYAAGFDSSRNIFLGVYFLLFHVFKN